MNVRDLIEELSEFDPNLRVVTGGFDEYNLDDVETVKLISVEFNAREKTAHYAPNKESYNGVEALFIDWD